MKHIIEAVAGRQKPTLREMVEMHKDDEKAFRRQAGIRDNEPELETMKEDRVKDLVKDLSPGAEDLIRTIHQRRR